jgi:hypothetical protein
MADEDLATCEHAGFHPARAQVGERDHRVEAWYVN